jgi:EF hand
MKHVTRIATVALALASAGAVLAQGAPAAPTATTPSAGVSPAADFSSMDQNKDGRLSSSEIQSNAGLQSSFASLDVNGDGYLSSSEFSKWDQAAKPKAMSPAHPAPGASDSPNPSTGPAASTPKY